MSTTPQITLYDTTLRDGAQGEGIHFSLADKLRLAQRLDAFGMHYIEGGWPGSNEKDIQFFREVKKLGLKNARVSAFGSTRRPNAAVETDPQIQLLLVASTPVVTLVCKASSLHVTEILRTTLEENLSMIRDSIAYLVKQGREVIFDGEHTFDGYKLDPEYTTKCYQAADEAGASYLVLCDTNGGSLPSEVAEITCALRAKVKKAKLGIHTHDDCGLGVANALAGIEAGAAQIQGTINGYGERTGNCNLITSIANLQLKMHRPVLSEEKLSELRDLSLFVDEVANQRPSGRAPFVGASAFAHKGGIHVNAVNKLAASYEHIKPEQVGNSQRVLVGELAGRANIMLKARTLGVKVKEKSNRTMRVLNHIKRLENSGYEFEAADASLKVLMQRASGRQSSYFDLIEYQVSAHKKRDRDVCKATIKLSIDNKKHYGTASGDGPVNALDGALRKALKEKYPQLKEMRLVDYKVRIIDSDSGTAAKTRVFIESTDGNNNWTTVGVSHDIIEASWIALKDSVEFALMPADAKSRLASMLSEMKTKEPAVQLVIDALSKTVRSANISGSSVTRLFKDTNFQRLFSKSVFESLSSKLNDRSPLNEDIAELFKNNSLQYLVSKRVLESLSKTAAEKALTSNSIRHALSHSAPKQPLSLKLLTDAASKVAPEEYLSSKLLANALARGPKETFSSKSLADALSKVGSQATFSSKSLADALSKVNSQAIFSSKSLADALSKVGSQATFSSKSLADAFSKVASSATFTSNLLVDAFSKIATVDPSSSKSLADTFAKIASKETFSSKLLADAFGKVGSKEVFSSKSFATAFSKAADAISDVKVEPPSASTPR